MTFDAGRVAKIYRDEKNTGSFGSGYLVTSDLVLTAAHVCASGTVGDSCDVRFLEGDRTTPWLDARIAWRDDTLDTALLRLHDDRWQPDRVTTVRWGRIVGTSSLSCRAAGFPAAQKSGDARYSELVEGRVNSITKREAHRYDISITSGAPSTESGRSLWKGISGAALYVGDFLVGVVRVDTAHFPGRLTAVPVSELAKVPEFAALIAASGTSLLIDDARESDLPYESSIKAFLATTVGAENRQVPFGGRNYELAYLDRWLTSDETRQRMLITAGAGLGKTSLLAHWVGSLRERYSDVSVVFVPISIRFEISTREEVFSALTTRVASAYGDPRPIAGGYAELRERLASLLSYPPPIGRRILIVIDGLDETTGWTPGPLLLPHTLGARVRVAVSARHVQDLPDASAWREQLGWNADATATMSLRPLSYDDVTTLVRGEVGSQDLDTAAELYRLTLGDPILLRLFIDDMRENGGRLPAVGSMAPGLKAYFDRWWTDQRQRWREEGGIQPSDLAIVFDLLALARGPIKRSELLQLTRRRQKMTGDELDEALHALRRFVVQTERSGFTVAHPRFAEHRVDKLRNDDELADRAEMILSWGREIAVKLKTTELTIAQAPDYIIRHFGEHLEDAKSSIEEMLFLVDPLWRAAWDVKTDEFAGHIPDVMRTAAATARADDIAVASGGRARWLPEQLWCLAAVADSSNNSYLLSGELVTELVRHRLWTSHKTFAYLRMIADDNQRAAAIDKVSAALDLSANTTLLELVDSVRDALSLERTDAVCGYIRFLVRHGMVDDAARSIEVLAGGDPHVRTHALVALLPGLPEERLAEGLLEVLGLLASPASIGEVWKVVSQLTSAVDREKAEQFLGYDPGYALKQALRNRVTMGVEELELIAAWLTPAECERQVSNALAQLPSMSKLKVYSWAVHLPILVNRDQASRLVDMLDTLLDPAEHRLTHLEIMAQVLPLLTGTQRETVKSVVQEGCAELMSSIHQETQAKVASALIKAGLLEHLLVVFPPEKWDLEGAETIASLMETSQLIQAASRIRVVRTRPYLPSRLLARLAARGANEAATALALSQEPLAQTAEGAAAAAVLRSLDTQQLDDAVNFLDNPSLRCAAWLVTATAAEIPTGVAINAIHDLLEVPEEPWRLGLAFKAFDGLAAAVPADELSYMYPLAAHLRREFGGIAFEPMLTYFRRLATSDRREELMDLMRRDHLPPALAANAMDFTLNDLLRLEQGEKMVGLSALIRFSPGADYDIAWGIIKDTVATGRLQPWMLRLLIKVLPAPYAGEIAGILFEATASIDEYTWPRVMEAIAPALSVDQVRSALMQGRELKSGGSRSDVSASMAMRLAVLGFEDESERELGRARTESTRRILPEMMMALSAQQLPWWFELVQRELHGRLATVERALVLASAAPRWAELDESTVAVILASWIKGNPPDSREDLLADIIAYAPGLIRLGVPATADRIIEYFNLLRCHYSRA